MTTIMAIGNFIFLWSWTPRTTPTHAPDNGLISTSNMLALKGLTRISFIGENEVVHESDVIWREIA